MKFGFDEIPCKEYIPVIRKYIEILKEKLGDNLVSVVLFGSVARGDAKRESDIDLLIVAEKWPKDFGERIKILIEIYKILEEQEEYRKAVKNGFHVSVSEYPLSVREAFKHGPLDLEILADGIILYDKNGFMKRKLEDLRLKLEKIGARREYDEENKRWYWVLKENVCFGEVVEI